MTAPRSLRAGFTIGVGLPTLGGDVDLAAASRHAEDLQFDSVSVADLIVGDGTPAVEALVAAAVAAAATSRVRVELGVIALPLRPVAWLAAQVQALQHVSGNRIVLAVGVGGVPGSPFWRALGVPREQRGRLTDAALEVLPSLITGEPTRLDDQPGGPLLTLGPPAPMPPVLVGGNSQAALRRAATYGDGWIPSQIGPDTLATKAASLRALAAEAQRPRPSVHVGGVTIAGEGQSLQAARAARRSFVDSLPPGHGISADEAAAMVIANPQEAAELVAAYAEAGADGVDITPGVDSSGEEWLRLTERAAEVRSLLGV